MTDTEDKWVNLQTTALWPEGLLPIPLQISLKKTTDFRIITGTLEN